MPYDYVGTARRLLQTSGPSALEVGDLRPTDLDHLAWSGPPTHLRQVAAALDRVSSGEVEYLVVRAPTGEPVAKVGINYTRHDDAGTLWQLVVHPELRGLRVGTRAILEAENRIRARRLRWAVLSVEDDNPRARSLYEGLGYLPLCSQADSWEQEAEDGSVILYETVVTVLRKRL